jgi:hypothetical protein
VVSTTNDRRQDDVATPDQSEATGSDGGAGAGAGIMMDRDAPSTFEPEEDPQGT